ncbi:MAG: DUF971 domain-containing protein [Armatimonadetes bacterium]|nr:DUF971 domain-containing protein [Armatimonadota bacterium]
MGGKEFVIEHADLNDTGDTLLIEWGDGHRSSYPLPYVRRHCPCATCRTLREQARENPLMVLPQNVTQPSAVMVGVEPVGRYGMRIAWEDEHDTGIYTFEYLRELCPCPECAAARQTKPVEGM